VRVAGKEHEGSAVHLANALHGLLVERKRESVGRKKLWQHEVVEEQTGCNEAGEGGGHGRERPTDEYTEEDAKSKSECGIAEGNDATLIK
jgi:hypothetical protein